MSAGHVYRADGWCRHPECLRHIADEPDFGACPDTHGDGIDYRNDVPPDKRETRRLRSRAAVSGLVAALAERFRWPR